MRAPFVVPPLALAAGTLLSLAAGPAPQTPPAVDVAEHPTSYAVGFRLGRDTRGGLSADGMGVDLDLVSKGFRDGVLGETPLIRRAEMQAVLQAVHREMEARRVRRLLESSPEFKELYDRNLERSRKFHELFGAQPGVVTLSSGAQYLELRSGGGATPGPDSTVLVRVKTKLLSGAVMNDGASALEVRVSDTIPGGAEILQMMSEGARWQVVLPPPLVYGEAGRFPDIGPNESLVAEVELIEIVSDAAPAEVAP